VAAIGDVEQAGRGEVDALETMELGGAAIVGVEPARGAGAADGTLYIADTGNYVVRRRRTT